MMTTTMLEHHHPPTPYSSSSLKDNPTHHTFESRQYLEEYFLDLNQEYEQLYRFWVWSTTYLKPGAIALEVGVGPTLYSTFPLAKACREIHLADYVTDSFIETRKWLAEQPDAFDWTPHIDLVLQTEAAIYHDAVSQQTTISQRATTTRKAIRQLLKCDMRQSNPLHIVGIPQQGALEAYDVVTAHYCTEAATSSDREWREAIANLLTLVKPGGYFFLSVCSNLNRFRQEADQHPVPSAPDIDATLVIRTLADLDMAMATLWLEEIPAPPGRLYSGTILVSVQKR